MPVGQLLDSLEVSLEVYSADLDCRLVGLLLLSAAEVWNLEGGGGGGGGLKLPLPGLSPGGPPLGGTPPLELLELAPPLPGCALLDGLEGSRACSSSS